MSNLFKKHPKKVGAALGLTAFGIQYFTSPALIQLATTTFAGLMSSFLPPAFALIGGLALTAALHIVVGIILAAAISRLFAQNTKQPKPSEQRRGQSGKGEVEGEVEGEDEDEVEDAAGRRSALPAHAARQRAFQPASDTLHTSTRAASLGLGGSGN